MYLYVCFLLLLLLLLGQCEPITLELCLNLPKEITFPFVATLLYGILRRLNGFSRKIIRVTENGHQKIP